MYLTFGVIPDEGETKQLNKSCISGTVVTVSESQRFFYFTSDLEKVIYNREKERVT